MNGVWCQVRIPMDDAVARAVVWVVANRGRQGKGETVPE